MKVDWNVTKGTLSHRTMMLMGYIQLLMISWVIQAKNVDRNAKKWKRPPKSLKNQMFIFGLCSTCDDQAIRAKKLTEMQKKKRPPKSSKMKCSFLDYVQLLMIIQAIGVTKFDWNVKKGPLSHHKMKCSFLDYVQLLMIIRVIGVTKFDWNVKKGPPSHHKMKCSFLDYVQLLMIGWAIRAMKVDWNVAKCPLSHRTMKCSFLGYIQLVMISWAIWAKKCWRKCKKMKKAPKSLKNEMFIFGLCSTSDDQLSDPSKKCWLKCKKMKKAPWVIEKSNVHFWIMFNLWWSAEQSKQKTLTEMQKNEKRPLNHQKMKCSFLDYIQLLMIG